MTLKSNSFPAAYYHNTYMEQFCEALHPDLDLGAVCVSWFRQAVHHCTDVIRDVRKPSAYFWTIVKNFIFPDRTTDLVSKKIPINIHPNRLTIQDCQSLFVDIVHDYVQRAPRYAAESTTNVMLWQVLYSLMGVMALGSLLVGIACTYKKYGQPKQIPNPLEELFKPEKRMQAVAKRSLRLSKAEMRNIYIKPETKPEHILSPDGCEVLVLKVSHKFDLMESIVVGGLQATGKLHRLYNQHNKTKSEFKIETLNRAMRFLDKDCKKLHLLLVFEKDVEYEEELAAKKDNNNSPRVRSLPPPETSSGRILDLSKKHVTKIPFEEVCISQKASSLATAIGFGFGTSRPSSPKHLSTQKMSGARKQTTTAISSGVEVTAIPRRVSKPSPISRRFK